MNIHFVGCLGASMKRLSEICVALRYNVSGSDMEIREGHNKENVLGKDLVVYTNAVGENNIEVLEAKKYGIKTIERAVFLGEISSLYKKVIAVSGTHGKTTTTSMLAEILRGQNACMHIGGAYPSLSIPPTDTDYFITEACEYKRSFLTLKPHLSIILNIELDHTDYFIDFDDYFNAYKQLASQSENVLVYGDDDILYNWAYKLGYKTFGLKTRNTYFATDITTTKIGSEFLMNFNDFKNNKKAKTVASDCADLSPFKIQIKEFGSHSVLNALASASSSHMLKIETSSIIKGLNGFTGVSRRQEFLTTNNGYDIFTDYAHHPSEIEVLINSIKRRGYKKIMLVFEPHTYTRTASLKKEFAISLSKADELFIMPVFAAREKELPIGKSETIIAELAFLGKTAYLMDNYNELFNYLNNNLFISFPTLPTALIFVGAGNIDNYARKFSKIY